MKFNTKSRNLFITIVYMHMIDMSSHFRLEKGDMLKMNKRKKEFDFTFNSIV